MSYSPERLTLDDSRLAGNHAQSFNPAKYPSLEFAAAGPTSELELSHLKKRFQDQEENFRSQLGNLKQEAN